MNNQPHCDVLTGKIYNAIPYSWVWWHEKGHLAFNDQNKTSNLLMWQGIAFQFWILATTLALFNKYMFYLSLPLALFYLGVDIYEEMWANKFAKENYRGIK